MKQTRIIFMGTPDFSVPALRALAGTDHFDIPLVITQPDRPRGRGKKLAPSPVKTAALALGIEVYQPEKLNTPEGLARLSALAPDFYVVAAFGQILSQAVLDVPSVYPVNVHASLLPRYRGAAPIQAAVMNMDAETGITTMVMAKGMDTGDMLLKETTPIHPEDTAQELHDRLAAMGGRLIVETIDRITAGGLVPEPQDHSRATYVSMLKKADGRINWRGSARSIQAHVNAMTPWPGAFTHLNGKRLKIFKAMPENTAPHGKEPGEILGCGPEGIRVAAGDGCVAVRELMGASGKRLTADAFLRGHRIDLPARFE